MRLETERLIIRDYEDSDVDDLVEGLNNINVSKWLGSVPYPYTKEHAINTINNSKRQQLASPRTLYNFVIQLKKNKKVIGGTSLIVDFNNQVGSGGIWISEKYRGFAYGKEAFNKRIDFAFNELGLRKIENGYFEGNESSKRMQLSLGYKIEGTKRNNYICKADGKIKSEVITGLLKEEWIPFKQEELFDTYDIKGNFLGVKTRSFCHSSNPGCYHKPVWIWIKNKENKILVQKRSINKDTFPGKWDMPSAGHVDAGEQHLSACVRETHEELGLKTTESDYIFLREWVAEENHEIAQIYLLVKDFSLKDIVIQKEEVDDVKLLDYEEFVDFFNSEEFCEYDPNYKEWICSILKKEY